MTATRITPLPLDAPPLATLPMPKSELTILPGLGSGLTKDAAGRIWAVCDRGPNLKVKLAIERYGLTALAGKTHPPEAKVMPCPAIGPTLSELVVGPDSVTIAKALHIRDAAGAAIGGLPPPGSDHGVTEPALNVIGETIPPDPSGADTEGLVALADGGFIVGDEYGPSLLHLSAEGVVQERWVPAGCESALADAPYPVRGCLPAIAARRQLNRGFEALDVSADGRTLYLAFQSALAHPDAAAHEQGRWTRIWKLAVATGELVAEFAYPFDPPASFRRDCAAGDFDWSDLKVSELTEIAPDRLLVLERGSHTTKLQLVSLDPAHRLDPAFADPDTRPTLEQMSASADPTVPLLEKSLLLSTDDHPEIGPDLEGMVLLGPQSLLIVNDNDFGIEGVRTQFWRLDLPTPFA